MTEYIEPEPSYKYYVDELPEEQLKMLIEKIKIETLKFIEMTDPEKRPLFDGVFEKYKDEIDNGRFYDIIKVFSVGFFNLPEKMKQNILNILVTKYASMARLLLEKDLQKEILPKVDLRKPLMIVGFPRSGTTFLHRLCCLDENAKPYPFYQALSPFHDTMSLQARKIMAVEWLKLFSEGFFQCHDVEIDNPEEETFSHIAISFEFFSPMSNPRFIQNRKYLFSHDHTQVYKDVENLFKFFILDSPFKTEKEYLCFKSPFHMYAFKEYINQFGKQANIVWIHREPIKQIKSFIQMIFEVSKIFYDTEGIKDYEWLNENIIRIQEYCFKKAIEARDKFEKENPDHKIYDVSFYELTRNPVETVKKIYEHFGIPISEEFISKLEENKEFKLQNRVGKKEVNESMYVFNEDEVRERFKFQYERFGKYIPDFYPSK